MSGWYNPEVDEITHWKPLSEPPEISGLSDRKSETESCVPAEAIKEYARRKGVRLWQLAYELGMQDSGLSRLLRKPLRKELADSMFAVIDKLGDKDEL